MEWRCQDAAGDPALHRHAAASIATDLDILDAPAYLVGSLLATHKGGPAKTAVLILRDGILLAGVAIESPDLPPTMLRSSWRFDSGTVHAP